MMKRCLKLVLALGLVLPMTGCMSRMAYDDESSRAEAEALVLKFAESMTQGRESALMEIASAPFWVDKWMVTLDELREEIPDDSPSDPPQLSGLKLRIYPLSDLAALRPKVWEQLKGSNPEWLKDVYLGAVALDLKDSDDDQPSTENGFLLLRRVNGAWKLAGLLEE